MVLVFIKKWWHLSGMNLPDVLRKWWNRKAPPQGHLTNRVMVPTPRFAVSVSDVHGKGGTAIDPMWTSLSKSSARHP